MPDKTRPDRRRFREVTGGAITLLVLGALMTPIAQKMLDHVWPTSQPSVGGPTQTPLPQAPIAVAPASKAAPPLVVEAISDLRSGAPGGSFALPESSSMSSSDLAHLNAMQPDSPQYRAWYEAHQGAAVGSGTVTITLRGNERESVRIADIKAISNCSQPYDGTYFEGYTQGTGQTLKMGFDLDSQDASASTMAFTGARGWFSTGEKYFDVNTVSFAQGEVETLSLNPFTENRSCSFSFRIYVATPSGTLYQDVRLKEPFRLTALAVPRVSGKPYSGYRSIYTQNAAGIWAPGNPKSPAE